MSLNTYNLMAKSESRFCPVCNTPVYKKDIVLIESSFCDQNGAVCQDGRWFLVCKKCWKKIAGKQYCFEDCQ